MAKQTVNIGDTGSQLVSKLGNNFDQLYPVSDALALRQTKTFNIVDYGAVGDNNTDNTTAIQNCIDDAAVAGGEVYIPSGIYKTHTLEIGPSASALHYKVNIRGDGQSSVLRSMAAEILIKYTDYSTFFRKFSNFVIDGNNVGTIGLHLYLCAYFEIENVYFYNIVTNGVKLTGSLIGKFNSCYWYNINNDGNIGVNAEPILYESGEHIGELQYACNLVTFNDCVFYTQRKYAVYWDTGSLVKFSGCNFEWNGTTDDLTTGCIYYLNNQEVALVTRFTPGLYLEGCWVEANAGIQVFIDDPGRADLNSRHVISNSHFSYNYSPNPNIKIIGIVGNNYLTLRNTSLSDHTGLWAYGANCHIVNDQSNLNPSTLVLDSGATYREFITRDGLLKSTPQASAPSAPTEGEMYCGTDHHLYYFNGTTWKQLDN